MGAGGVAAPEGWGTAWGVPVCVGPLPASPVGADLSGLTAGALGCAVHPGPWSFPVVGCEGQACPPPAIPFNKCRGSNSSTCG